MVLGTVGVILSIASVATASWGGTNSPLCSTECPIAAAKLSYIPGQTYSYIYSGNSTVEVNGLDGGVTQTLWAKQVDLTWMTPCDVAITLTFPSEQQDETDVKFLQQYPLMVAVSDGRVQRVCSHPDDEAWAINIKKGIASALQNTLPSLTDMDAPQNITETDVVGQCRTLYQVEGDDSQVVVTKEKNHRYCQHRYYTPSHTNIPWLKTALPVQESWSKCTQEINDGIITSVKCEDKNVIKPMMGAYRFITATQNSTLSYLSMSSGQPDAISTLSSVTLVNRSLLYDYQEPRKNETFVSHLEETLEYICLSTKDGVNKEAASLMARAVHLMRLVPNQVLPQILDKIRSGEICPDSPKLESLFLDAIAFVQDFAEVKIMVDEMVSGRATKSHIALYTAALYLLPRPCTQAISALQPLFESDRPPATTKLVAASMVRTYCRHNPQCFDEAPVRNVTQTLSRGIQCSSPEDPDSVLTNLKALGNTGVITRDVANSVLTCIETDTANTNIRIAAAQAFRLAQCRHETTWRLINFAVDPAKDTEVRIAAYLAAVHCAGEEDLQRIISSISEQPNTQVRGFILSHLLNIQQSDAPEKQQLRYNLTNIIVPRNFEADLRKYSRNIDLSYWLPSLGVGVGVESNLIYAPGSFIPRSLHLYLSAALDGIAFNIAELGARVQGLETIVVQALGPDGYFATSSYQQIFQDAVAFIQKNWRQIQRELENFRQRRSLDYSVISSFISSIYGDSFSEAQFDAFARILGQEISFASLTGDPRNFDSMKIIKNLVEKLRQLLPDPRHIDVDTARTAQLNLDYSFATIQGTPFRLKLHTTTVTALKMKGNLISLFSDEPQDENVLDISPSITVEMDGFIGYDAYMARTGLKTKTVVSSATGATMKVTVVSASEKQVKLDIPDEMELVSIESETYLMRNKRGQPDTRIIPPSVRDIRHPGRSCFTAPQSVTGLNLCYDVNVPDVIHSIGLPLVASPAVVRLHLDKINPSLGNYKLNITTKNREGSQVIKIGVESPSIDVVRKSELYLTHTVIQGSHILSAEMKTEGVHGVVWVDIINEDTQKVFEAFVRYSSQDTQLFHGVKVDLQIHRSSSDVEYDLEVYSSPSRNYPSQSRVIQAKLSRSFPHPEISWDIMFKTDNAIRRYVELDFILKVDTVFYHNIPVPSNLYELDFHFGMMRWGVESIISKASSSSESVEYSSSFKLTRGDQIPVSIEGSTAIEGTLRHNFSIRTAVNFQLGTVRFKIMKNARKQGHNFNLDMEMLCPTENLKLFSIMAAYIQSEPSIAAKLEIDMPQLGDSIKFEMKVADTGENDYIVKLGLIQDDVSLVHIQGPVSVEVSHRALKFHSALAITFFKFDPFKIPFGFEFSDHEEMVYVGVSKESQEIMHAEYRLSAHRKGMDYSTIAIKILLPGLIENKVDIVAAMRYYQFVMKSVVFPGSPSSHGIKIDTSVDVGHGRVTAKVAWDEDKDPSQMVQLEGHYFVQPLVLTRFGFRGTLTWLSQPYNFRVNTDFANPFVEAESQNSLQLEVVTPAHETHSLEAQINTQHRHILIMVDSHVMYKDPAGSQHRFRNRVNWEMSDYPYGFKVDSLLSHLCPDGNEESIDIQATHENSPQQRIIDFKASVSALYMTKPIVTELQVANQENSYKTKVLTIIHEPATMFDWQLETFPEGGVRVLDTSVDMKVVRDYLHELLKKPIWKDQAEEQEGGKYEAGGEEEAGREEGGEEKERNEERREYEEGGQYETEREEGGEYHAGGEYEEGRKADGEYKTGEDEAEDSDNTVMSYRTRRTVLRSRYHRLDPSTHSLTLQSPSRTLEGLAKYSPSEFSLEVYPNRDEGEAKYEMAAKSSHGYFGSRYEGHMRHPSLTKDIAGYVEFSSSGETHEGCFQFDVFPDTADKVTSDVRSTFIANNTVRVEMDLQSRVLLTKPHIVVATAWTSHTKAVDFAFHTSLASLPSLALAFKYDHTTDQDAVMAGRVDVEEVTVVEFSGVLRSQVMPDCLGHHMDIKVSTFLYGDFDVESDLCKPTFIKLVTKNTEGRKSYISQLGLKHPSRLEVSLSESEEWEDARPIVLAGVQLASPTIVTVEAAYQEEEYQEIKESLSEKAEYVWHLVKNRAEDVYQELQEEARQQNFTFPDPELVTVAQQVKEEARQIYQEVMDDMVYPVWDMMSHFSNCSFVSSARQVIEWAWSGIAQVQESYTETLSQHVKGLNLYGFVKLIRDIALDVERWLLLGEEPEVVQRILEDLEKTTLYRLIKEDFVDSLTLAYPDLSQALDEVVRNMRKSLAEDLYQLMTEAMNWPIVNQFTERIIRYYESGELWKIFLRDSIIKLLEEASLVSVRSDQNYLTFHIPIHKPMYSLGQLLQEIIPPYPVVWADNYFWLQDVYIPTPIKNVIWSYYNLKPQHLLPPYNASAIVVDKTNLMTFDGAVLTIPRSHCKVLLTSIPGVARVLMSHPDEIQPASNPEVTFEAGNNRVTISPNFTVTLNGEPVSGERIEPPLIIQVTPNDTRVMSPLLGLYMLRDKHLVMLNVSGWAFNHTWGLLGSYDGEVATDWYTPTGRKAHDLKDLARSWQEDPSCPTPDVDYLPKSMHMLKAATCHFSIGMRSLCMPVVNPEPYIQLCYNAFKYTDANAGYRAVCASRGVPYPPPFLPCETQLTGLNNESSTLSYGHEL